MFFLPAASHVEKKGSFTNTQRMLQWRHQAVQPPGDARSDLQFYYELGQRIRARLAGSTDEMDRPLLDLTWDYPTEGPLGEPDAEAVLREINGWDDSGDALSSYTQLATDGSTACGCWIYCGVYADETNQAARRKPHWEQSLVAPEWGWVWPANRRILYNRASADPDGKPWSERKKYVWWDAEQGSWTGDDVPDFVADRPPDHVPEEGATGPDALGGRDPFIMQTDGKAWLYVPDRPRRRPAADLLRAGRVPRAQRRPPAPAQPRARGRRGAGQPAQPAREPRLPLRVHELPAHRAPHRRRDVAHPALPQRAPAGDVLRGLAAPRRASAASSTWGGPRSSPPARPSRPGSWSPPGCARSASASSGSSTSGLPYHWGANGLVTGDSVNDLVGVALDPNVHIQDKVGTCDIRPGRRPRGPALVAFVDEYRRRSGAHPAEEDDS